MLNSNDLFDCGKKELAFLKKYWKTTSLEEKIGIRRVVAFKDLKSLSTRLINALETTDTTDQTVKDAKGRF